MATFYRVSGRVVIIDTEGPQDPSPYKTTFPSKDDESARRRVPVTPGTKPQVLYLEMRLYRFEGPGKTGTLIPVPL
jgi:hypothetical protein